MIYSLFGQQFESQQFVIIEFEMDLGQTERLALPLTMKTDEQARPFLSFSLSFFSLRP